MFNPIRVVRELNTKNIEVYRIDSVKFNFEYYVLIVDLRRKSTKEDFPNLAGLDEEDIVRDNLIVGAYITNKHFKDYEQFEPITTIVSDLIEHKESCSQKFEVFEDDIPEDIGMGHGVVEFTNKYLKKLGVNPINDIELYKFNFLSQD